MSVSSATPGKMKIACIQMNTKLGCTEENFAHAEALICEAVKSEPDVIVLPETWNTGFIPKENLRELCCHDGDTAKAHIGALAKKYGVNIVAGSVSNLRGEKTYNTALIFDRSGACIAEYDKIHLVVPTHEADYFTPGDRPCTFTLDGVKCGIIICNDLRFPELARKLALSGIDVLFMVAQWPKGSVYRLRPLTLARAIENQIFFVCCNACAEVYGTGGSSAIIDPYGKPVALAGETEMILTAECDLGLIAQIRKGVSALQERRPELY